MNVTVTTTLKFPKLLPLEIYLLIDSTQSTHHVLNHIIDHLSNISVYFKEIHHFNLVSNLKDIGAESIHIGVGLYYDKEFPPVSTYILVFFV